MAYKVSNNAFSTLAGAINSIATSLTVGTGHGDRFPVITGADHTFVTLEDASGNIEIVKVTARATASDVMTIVRAQDGTTARSWAAGDVIECRVIAALLNDAIAHAGDTTDAHAASAITNTPAGNIAATTVQAALNELDADLSSVSSNLTAHLNDTTAAHAASAISYAGGTGMSATDVEGAIDELANEKANLAGGTFTGAVNFNAGLNTARGSVTMHATTMDLWAQANIIDGTGSAVTITAIANAPQAGATRKLYPTAGTKITHGATFDVEGASDYTTVAGDALIFEAITVSTYKVWVDKDDGTAAVGVPQNSQNANYTLALTDNNKHIYSANTGAQTITVPTNAVVALPVGAAITIVNNGTTDITFTTTGTTVYKAGTSAAWASGGVMAVRGLATLLKVATDTWFISGAGLS